MRLTVKVTGPSSDRSAARRRSGPSGQIVRPRVASHTSTSDGA